MLQLNLFITAAAVLVNAGLVVTVVIVPDPAVTGKFKCAC